ncbi:hypothetical protein PMAYCL1PPCAC_19587, partial [Pristionchus mayeri]
WHEQLEVNGLQKGNRIIDDVNVAVDHGASGSGETRECACELGNLIDVLISPHCFACSQHSECLHVAQSNCLVHFGIPGKIVIIIVTRCHAIVAFHDSTSPTRADGSPSRSGI